MGTGWPLVKYRSHSSHPVPIAHGRISNVAGSGTMTTPAAASMSRFMKPAPLSEQPRRAPTPWRWVGARRADASRPPPTTPPQSGREPGPATYPIKRDGTPAALRGVLIGAPLRPLPLGPLLVGA